MKAQRMSLDTINTLPPSIIEDILCRVMLQEAARTSILSKEWRYKWTTIPKLHFYNSNYGASSDENELCAKEQTMASERNKMRKRCKFFCTIYQILLAHQGPILDFSLSMEVNKTCIEIDHIMTYLSRNNCVQKLRFDLMEDTANAYYWVPLSIFSLHHLTDLYLRGCDLNHQPTFNGFPRLTTLYLKNVYISSKSLLHLLSNCPLLKDLTLLLHDEHIICDDDNKYTIVELFECLPMIERLTTWSMITSCFSVDLVPQELPISLVNLKYLSLEYTSYGDKDDINFVASVMRCSPNLEKINIGDDSDYYQEINFKAYSDIWLEHLNELEISGFNNSKHDLVFLKFILAKSPELKKLLIHCDWYTWLDKDDKSCLLRNLLCSPPASPVVNIIVD